jgi:hypothetical protein
MPSWRRRRTLAGWAIATVIATAIAVLFLGQAVRPTLIWSHLGGTPVSVRGAATNYWDRHGMCSGWVLPDATPVPVSELNGWRRPIYPDASRPGVRRVDISGAGRCVDGQYWASPPGAHTAWPRSPSAGELLHQLFNIFWGYFLLNLAMRAARRCRAAVTADPPVERRTGRTPWDRARRGPRPHSVEEVAPGALRAEPRLARVALSLTIYAGIVVAVAATFVISFSLLEVYELPTWIEALAFIAPFAVGLGAVDGNRKFSSAHRDRIRDNSVAFAGVVVDCDRRTTGRFRSSALDYWIRLTVLFDDPEREAPQRIHRTYLFRHDPDGAADFAAKYGEGVKVAVHRGARKIWYVLDVDDAHLAWSQWW